MIRDLARCAPLALLVALAGCGHSPATRILTLDTVPPVAAGAAYRGPPIVVPAVHLPAVLDRPDYVRPIGPGQEHVDDFAQWAAPLGLLARDTLVHDLIVRMPAGAVLPPGTAAGAGSRTVDVTILSFTPGPGQAALQAAFRMLPHGTVQTLDLRTDSAGTDDVAGARAFAALLGQLADRIAASAAASDR